jgi:hypothetical protein
VFRACVLFFLLEPGVAGRAETSRSEPCGSESQVVGRSRGCGWFLGVGLFLCWGWGGVSGGMCRLSLCGGACLAGR